MNFNKVEFETAFGTSSQLQPSTMPEIAFSGKSNVGKSSLLNKILNRKSIARVSSVPGKTVTINFFKLDDCRFVDLPGYGYAKVNYNEKKRWADLMESYFSTDRDIRLVVQLLDMRHKPTELDLQMIEYMNYNNIPFVVALTKADKLNKTEKTKQLDSISAILSEYGDIQIIPFSATKGEGADQLREAIERALTER